MSYESICCLQGPRPGHWYMMTAYSPTPTAQVPFTTAEMPPWENVAFDIRQVFPFLPNELLICGRVCKRETEVAWGQEMETLIIIIIIIIVMGESKSCKYKFTCEFTDNKICKFEISVNLHHQIPVICEVSDIINITNFITTQNPITKRKWLN